MIKVRPFTTGGNMSKYQCMACEETSDMPFTGGACSKCGSLNIRNMDLKRVRKNTKEKADPKKTFLMVLLWAFIIYSIATYA